MFAIAATIVVWFKFVLRYSKLPKLAQSDEQPVILGVQHCESPSRFELKGKRVVATGIIFEPNRSTRSVELHGFPFAVRVIVSCKFAADDHQFRQLQSLDLISVIGTAAEEIVEEGDRCRLQLTDCYVRRPAFFDRIRHWLVNGPIGGPLRHWWYLGWF